jgi:Tfp pilus assembly protein PilO
MNVSKQRLSQNSIIGIAVAGALVLLLGGYLLLVAPQRAKAAHAKKETAQVEKEMQSVRDLTAKRKNAPKIKYANLYQLTKAMPDTVDIADALIALNALASDSGISFDEIAPQTAVILPNYQAIPIKLTFTGNYFALVDFLYRLRSLVRVRNGELDAYGRLYAVDEVDFGPPPPPAKFPTVRANLLVSAFVYGNPSAAVAAAAPPATDTTTTGATSSTDTGSTDTTATTTAPTDTTTTPAALGANP